MTRVARSFALVVVAACGARTPLDASASDARDDHAGAADAATDPIEEPIEEPPACDFGTIVTDVFGGVVSWNGGAALPAGHYRVTYVDGCMKYSSGQAWSVNAYAEGPDTLFVVGDGSTIAAAPGTVGFLEGQGGFATFDECVSANVASDAPLEFDFAGGTLGLRLADNPYADNAPGENGRSPTYRLSSCP